MSPLKHWFWPVVISCLLIVALAWPALYNGQPIFFQDTTAYIRGADAGMSRLTHRSTIWTDRNPVNSKNVKTAQASSMTGAGASVSDKVVLAGRSVYYGMALYLAHVLGRLWPAVFVQAAIVLASIWLTMRAFGVFTLARLASVALVLAIFTPLSFFTSFLMPDLFAGLAILAAANLLVWGNEMQRWVLFFWAALLTAALLFHTSHILTITGVLAFTTVVLARRRGMMRMHRVGWTAVLLAIVVGLSGEIAFNIGVKKMLGVAPVRPPYVSARLIVDGPGYRYLVANCGSQHFAICQFLNRLPMSDSDDFLWSVTDAADPDTRRKLGEEQFGFAWAVTRFDPFGVAAASARDTTFQLSRIGVEEFRYWPGKETYYGTHLPEPYLSEMRLSKAWKGQVPTGILAIFAVISTVFSVGLIIVLAVSHQGSVLRDRSALLFTEVIIAGVLINAFICGSISMPHDRYEARVIWLLPLTAFLLWQRSRRSYSETSVPAAERLASA